MSDEEKERKISEWMKVFQGVYSDSDLNRSPEQIWIAIMAYCSKIGESIRISSFLELIRYAAHVFCWLCSYINKCNQLEDNIFSFTGCLSSMVSLKYPLICGYCEQNICNCEPETMDKIKDKAAHYKKLLKYRKKVNFLEFTISQWQEVFKNIYGGRIHISMLESVGFHFLEEVGEGAVAVRELSEIKNIVAKKNEGIDSDFLNGLSTVEGIVHNYTKYHQSEIDYTSQEPKILKARIVNAKMSIVIEIADTFSWLCSILNKLDSISQENRLGLPSLEDELNKEYFDKGKGNFICPTCKQKNCSCVFFS